MVFALVTRCDVLCFLSGWLLQELGFCQVFWTRWVLSDYIFFPRFPQFNINVRMVSFLNRTQPVACFCSCQRQRGRCFWQLDSPVLWWWDLSGVPSVILTVTCREILVNVHTNGAEGGGWVCGLSCRCKIWFIVLGSSARSAPGSGLFLLSWRKQNTVPQQVVSLSVIYTVFFQGHAWKHFSLSKICLFTNVDWASGPLALLSPGSSPAYYCLRLVELAGSAQVQSLLTWAVVTLPQSLPAPHLAKAKPGSS